MAELIPNPVQHLLYFPSHNLLLSWNILWWASFARCRYSKLPHFFYFSPIYIYIDIKSNGFTTQVALQSSPMSFRDFCLSHKLSLSIYKHDVTFLSTFKYLVLFLGHEHKQKSSPIITHWIYGSLGLYIDMIPPWVTFNKCVEEIPT